MYTNNLLIKWNSRIFISINIFLTFMSARCTKNGVSPLRQCVRKWVTKVTLLLYGSLLLMYNGLSLMNKLQIQVQHCSLLSETKEQINWINSAVALLLPKWFSYQAQKSPNFVGGWKGTRKFNYNIFPKRARRTSLLQAFHVLL